ncbi:hypothetical protein EPUS_00525 [Endocarpon pusillum Z07020]|uniref:Clr5 domain-containing protein n=1 Tax=Endocarpon pusillum (strain Z07020 / HMAS-L-300199) TaxID=1263415 RepID=U1GIA2_ENDPU|nr:uncharacterized protein EPUS_00525 [Endocarpon pusillum Z07020]ERF71536.1 hypothetical protein EPUS_00525 [Endocarpon pusillum Z07020]
MTECREYDPEQSSRKKRIAPQVWDEMRPLILELYLTEQRTGLRRGQNTFLSQKDVLLTFLSTRQYTFALKKWKVTKNTPGRVKRSAARKLHENPKRHGFQYKQRALSPLDISRCPIRYPGFDPASSPTASTPSQMTWETATNASMTPRAASPRASAADNKQSDSIDLKKMTDAMLDLSHEQAQGSVQDLARTPEARTLISGIEEQVVTSSHRQGWNTDSQFARLKWRLELLLDNLEAGKTVEYSDIESCELWLSVFEPSRKSEENLISLFKDILTRIKAMERMKRQSLSSDTGSCLKRRKMSLCL